MKPTDAMLVRIAERFRALGDETRLRLLLAVQAGEQTVNALAAAAGTSQPCASKHLALMKTAGLVQVRRVGNQAWYRVRDDRIFGLCDIVCGCVQRSLDEDQAALSGAAAPVAASRPKRSRRPA
jgi:DNA-binding transcriptional ArsR family regulator